MPEMTTAQQPGRPSVSFAFFNAMTWQVALGTPMVLMAERLGASALTVGVAYSFVFLLTPVQVLSTALLPRYGYKRMMLSGWGTRSLFLLPVIGLAWWAPEPGTALHVAIFVGSLFMFTLLRSIGTCAWLPWINSLLTAENRGAYFALEQVVSGIAGVGTLLICYVSLRALDAYPAFLLQYSFAFVGSWFAYLALSRLPDVEKPSALPLTQVFRDTPRLVVTPGSFREFVCVSVIVGAAVTAIPPFCAYYLRVGPRFSEADILLCTTAQYLGVISGAWLIRHRVDRVGARPFFHLSLVLYALVAVFWLALLRGWDGGLTWVYGIYLLLGAAASCWAAANMKYLPLVVTAENRTLAFSVHSAVTSVASGVAAAVWGQVLKGPSDQPSLDVGGFQIFFGVALATTIVVAVLVRRLPAFAGAPSEWVLGGPILRPFRGLTYLATLAVPRSRPDSNSAATDRRGDDKAAQRAGESADSR